jgi:preprotein translocase subunit SecA
VLVGTTSIESSELLSKRLTQAKLKHQVLNAKQHEKEAHIIAQAGQKGVITIATNMAGRGTDIVLGGNIEADLDALESKNIDKSKNQKLIKDLNDSWKKNHDEVVKAGGLHIVGTERHESRRIDNQLRGRSGRQGDPGSSSFYLSLEDPLLRIFGSDRVASIMEKLDMPAGEPIQHPWVNRSIEGAQRKVEGRNFDIRKQLLEFDDVPNQQRRVIYEQRNDILNSDDLEDTVNGIVNDVLEQTVYEYMPPESVEEMWDIPSLEKRMLADYGLKVDIKAMLKKDPNLPIEDIIKSIQVSALKQYRQKEKVAGKEALHHFERSIMLQIFDHHWRSHLSAQDQLRQGIGLRAYGQKDPKQEFKRESFALFEQLLETIKFEITRVLMLVVVKDEKEARRIDEQNQASVDAAKSNRETSSQAGNNTPTSQTKVGRNDPCPCGSGKKYKHCHGALA